MVGNIAARDETTHLIAISVVRLFAPLFLIFVHLIEICPYHPAERAADGYIQFPEYIFPCVRFFGCCIRSGVGSWVGRHKCQAKPYRVATIRRLVDAYLGVIAHCQHSRRVVDWISVRNHPNFCFIQLARKRRLGEKRPEGLVC